MKNYYEFKNFINDEESINHYICFNTKQLKIYLSIQFDDVEYYLNYYAEFLKDIFNGTDCNDHYYMLKALTEELNNIKIILNILKGRDEHE